MSTPTGAMCRVFGREGNFSVKCSEFVRLCRAVPRGTYVYRLTRSRLVLGSTLIGGVCGSVREHRNKQGFCVPSMSRVLSCSRGKCPAGSTSCRELNEFLLSRVGISSTIGSRMLFFVCGRYSVSNEVSTVVRGLGRGKVRFGSRRLRGFAGLVVRTGGGAEVLRFHNCAPGRVSKTM